jgi:hypothetical protein
LRVECVAVAGAAVPAQAGALVTLIARTAPAAAIAAETRRRDKGEPLLVLIGSRPESWRRCDRKDG